MHIAKFLLANGAEVNAKGGDLLGAPLHWASRAGNVQMASVLVAKSADLLLCDSQGYNPFHLASHQGHVFMLIYLASLNPILVNSRDSLGRTALMWVAYQGNSISSLDFLVKYGRRFDLVGIDYISADQKIPLTMLPSSANDTVIMDLVDSLGYTALHWAVITRHWEFADILIGNGADIHIRDLAGKNIFDWCRDRNITKLPVNLESNIPNRGAVQQISTTSDVLSNNSKSSITIEKDDSPVTLTDDEKSLNALILQYSKDLKTVKIDKV